MDSYKAFLKEAKARRAWIRREYAKTKSYTAIATKLGITRQRVKQIVKSIEES